MSVNYSYFCNILLSFTLWSKLLIIYAFQIMKIMDIFINLEIVSCPFPIVRESETISLGAIMSIKFYGKQFNEHK